MNNVLNSISKPMASGISQEQIDAWTVTTNIYIAKIMALGGYTRNDIMQNIVAHLKEKKVVWNDNAAEHHSILHDFLEAIIAEEIKSAAAKITDMPFVITAVDPEVVTLIDMGSEANALVGIVPNAVVNILRIIA